MGQTHVYGARAEKLFQNADFAMKQTNICRLSGDIKIRIKTKSVISIAESVCIHVNQYAILLLLTLLLLTTLLTSLTSSSSSSSSLFFIKV